MIEHLPALPAATPYGTRAQLAAADGSVQGALALVGCDRRAGTASYALRVVNETAQPLQAQMTCVRRGSAMRVYPLDLHVAPFSVAETLLPVRIAEVGPYDRALVRVAGTGVAFSLEAPAPPRAKRRTRIAILLTSAAIFTLICAFGAAAVTPRFASFAAPQRVLAGTVIGVPYAYEGWAAMQYRLATADGRQIAAGTRTGHTGSLQLRVPASAGRRLTLSANVSGPFGERGVVRHITIAAPPPAHHIQAAPAAAPPRIDGVAVATAAVHAGGTVRLVYDTNARGGVVRLIDANGRLRAQAPLSSSGTVTLAVPHGTTGQRLHAMVIARNGAASASASVGFQVVPWPSQPAQREPALRLSSQTAASGAPVTVSIEQSRGEAQVVLTDASGDAVEQSDLPAGQNAVTLTAPAVTAPATFYVTATIHSGYGEQTLVKKLTVTP